MKINKKSIIILASLIVCIVILVFIQFNNKSNSFFGVYEVTDKAFIFEDVDYNSINLFGVNTDSEYSLPKSITRETVPKQRYFVDKNNFSKLFNIPTDSPYTFKLANTYDKYLILENVEYTYKYIKTLTEEEINKDRFLNEYIKSVKPIEEIKKGVILKIHEENYEELEQYIYLIDDIYYSYDEIYAVVLQKIK